MKEIKNVVIVNDFEEIRGGSDKIAIQTANLLADNSELNVYFFTGSTTSSNVLSNKVKVIYTNQTESIKDKNIIRGIICNIFNIKSYNFLKNLLLTLNPDETIIHYHGWTKILSSSVFYAGFKMKFKTILTAHECFTCCANGVFYNFRKNELCSLKGLSSKCLLCNCDNRNYLYKILRYIRLFVQNKCVKVTKKIKNVVIVSEANKKLIEEYFDNKTNFFQINNPTNSIDLKKKQKNDYYLFVGRFEKSKGIIDFCNVIEENALHGIAIGDGELYKYCKDNYKHTEFIGWKDQNTISEYMLNAKALIYPSLAYESFGLSISDALCLGTPVICSAVCGGKVLIRDGENGYVYKDYKELDGDIKQFELKNLHVNKEEALSIRNNLSEDVYLRNILSAYHRILNS